MQTVSIADAVAKLPELIEGARQGRPFSIVEAGKATVRVELEPVAETKPFRSRIGFLKGKISAPDDFDTMLDELIGADE